MANVYFISEANVLLLQNPSTSYNPLNVGMQSQWNLTDKVQHDCHVHVHLLSTGQPGHFANACTNGSGYGNSSFQNKNSGYAGGNGATGGKLNVCYKCGQPGHFASACSQGQSKRSFNTSSANTKRGMCGKKLYVKMTF